MTAKPAKINIDDLFVKQRSSNEQRTKRYNTILSQIHTRIQYVGKYTSNKDVIYKIPLFVLGESTYSFQECAAYIIQQLTENGFTVEASNHILFISWENWIPSYKRAELRKQGIYIDAQGNPMPDPEEQTRNDGFMDINSGSGLSGSGLSGVGGGGNRMNFTHDGYNEMESSKSTNSRYKPISAYQPKRSVVYDDDLLKQTEKRLNHAR